MTVNQAAIAAGLPSIHVHDTRTDVRRDLDGIVHLIDAVITQGPPQQDGARVWIECAMVVPDRD